MTSFNYTLQRFLIIPIFFLLIGVGQILLWAYDREPPYQLISYESEIGHPGHPIRIISKVKRDASRNCSVEYSRHVIDSNGTEFNFGTSAMSDEAIDRMEERAPGRGDVSFVVPEGIALGRAEVETVLMYHCNPMHSLWPIQVTVRRTFMVEP